MSHITNLNSWETTLPLNGISANIHLIGQYNNQVTGQTSAYGTDFTGLGAKIFVKINSLSGSGNITITGTSVNSNGIKTTNDTENIYIDTAGGQRYKSDKNWIEVTNVSIGAGISSINYDIGRISYMSHNNRKFEWLGYSMDVFANNSNADLTIRVIKVKNEGNKKFSLLDLESYSIDSGASGNQIIDNIRTGADDRSYNPIVSQILPGNRTYEIKQFDMHEYWLNHNQENIVNGHDGEGILLKLEGYPLDTNFNNIGFLTIYFLYKMFNEL